MNIMLIDDDFDCLEDLMAALEPAGHTCDKYTLPVKAVEAFIPNKYDVVITDMKMPLMSGIEVLRRIKSVDSQARVIINTGYGDVETAIAAVNNGAYAFFGKPLDINELMAVLEKIEAEKSGQRVKMEEQARLAMEYARLKQAYEDLQKLLKENESKRSRC